MKKDRMLNTEELSYGAGKWEREIFTGVEIHEKTYNTLNDLSLVHTSGIPFWSLL